MKKNIITKAATVAVALLMASSFLTACTGEKGATLIKDQPIDDTCVEAIVNGELTTIAKPEKIIMMVDTTFMGEENRVGTGGVDVFTQEYKRLTGIDLEIEIPSHNQYYEKVNLSFASNNVPNIIELGSTYYPNYSAYGALWDMSEAYDTSTAPMKDIIDPQFVEAVRIGENGELYGFPNTRGNGTVTYVRGDWMDQLGLENPTNYEEFLNMLRQFKTIDGCYAPLTVSGFINSESPYNIYLKEFYWDADPHFYYDETQGKYVDGMSQPAMVGALERMRDAYAEGLIDKEAITNTTSDCRDKFNTGQAGCFNYWAGAWNRTLENNMTKTDEQKASGEKIVRPIEPIVETQYVERPPTVMSITSKSNNPMGIYKYLIEFAHDGGEGQMLFTHGVEGDNDGKTKTGHWKIDENGNCVAVPYFASEKLVEKVYFSPELTITTWDDPIPLDEQVEESLAIFSNNSYIVPVPKTSDEMSDELPELDTVRKEVISKVVTGKTTVEEGIKEYQTRCASQIEIILNSLNS